MTQEEKDKLTFQLNRIEDLLANFANEDVFKLDFVASQHHYEFKMIRAYIKERLALAN